jgi:hypothetical protein
LFFFQTFSLPFFVVWSHGKVQPVCGWCYCRVKRQTSSFFDDIASPFIDMLLAGLRLAGYRQLRCAGDGAVGVT